MHPARTPSAPRNARASRTRRPTRPTRSPNRPMRRSRRRPHGGGPHAPDGPRSTPPPACPTSLSNGRRGIEFVDVDVDVDELVDRLAKIPGVVAVALGGSRARGAERPDSDWDLALYYRGTIDPDDVRALGYEGTVVAPGEWAYPMNGGAWLSVDGEKVDLLYRDLDDVEHWIAESDAGRWNLYRMPNYLAGMASYVVVGELALARV